MPNLVNKRFFGPKDLFPVGTMGLITLWLFGDVILKGHLLWGSDFITTYLPYKQFLYEEIQQHGSIPSWNPYLFSGMPFWGFFESTIFYPFDLLFWLVPPEKAYGYTMALHMFMASLFMYALVRKLGLNRWASLLAAMLFSYNNFIIPFLGLGHMVLVQSYAWTPLVLLVFISSLESKRSTSSAILAGLCWGLQILGADPQTAFYTYGALVLFALIHEKPFGTLKRGLEILKILFVVFFIGFGISAVQLVPSMEFSRLSTRGVLSTFEMVTLASFPPQGIITLIMPHFFGTLYDNSFWVANVPWSIPEYNLYIGIVPLLLIFFVRYRPIHQEKLLLFCVILGVVSLLLALGRHTPIYRLCYLLPGFDSFRAPSKIIVLWDLAISILTARGLHDLITGKTGGLSWRWTALGAIALCLLFMNLYFLWNPGALLGSLSYFLLPPISPDHLALAEKLIQSQFHRMSLFLSLGIILLYLTSKGHWRGYPWVSIILVVFFADLCGSNNPYIVTSDQDYAHIRMEKEKIAEALRKDKDVFRVGGVGSRFGPNMEMYYGLQTPSGAGPLILYRYYLYCNQFYRKIAPPGWQVLRYGAPGSQKFMDLLNVRYMIDHENRKVHQRKTPLPRSILVSDFKVLPAKEILPYMDGDDFNPRVLVLFEENPFEEASGELPLHPAPGETGTTRIEDYRPDRILLRVHAHQDAFLVLHDIHYPGWKCYVDGTPQKILRGNYLFRVVRIPKGGHTVLFLFEPLSIKIGMGMTIAAGCLIILGLCFLRHPLIGQESSDPGLIPFDGQRFLK